MSGKAPDRDRPKPEGVTTQVRRDGELKEGQVWDLDSIVRAILWDLEHEPGQSQGKLAKRFGFTQQTLSNYGLAKVSSTTGLPPSLTLRILTKICASLGEDPDVFFTRHELYKRDMELGSAESRRIEEGLLRRIRTAITPDSLRRLAEILERLNWSESAEKLQHYLQIGEDLAGIRNAEATITKPVKGRSRRK